MLGLAFHLEFLTKYSYIKTFHGGSRERDPPCRTTNQTHESTHNDQQNEPENGFNGQQRLSELVQKIGIGSTNTGTCFEHYK